jgi:hypothetical protein
MAKAICNYSLLKEESNGSGFLGQTTRQSGIEGIPYYKFAGLTSRTEYCYTGTDFTFLESSIP